MKYVLIFPYSDCYLEITVEPEDEAVDKGDEEESDGIPLRYPF